MTPRNSSGAGSRAETSAIAAVRDTLSRNAPALLRDRPVAERVLTASRYVQQWLTRADAETQQDFAEAVAQPVEAGALTAHLAALDTESANDEAFMAGIRRLRNRVQAQIAWRSVAGQDTLEATLRASSALADACIDRALGRALRAAEARYGTPRDAAGEAVPCAVVGMGKLGGCELNYSSDVDLMLFYRAPGECDGRRQAANEQYFGLVVQLLTRYLGEVTADGFVFRIDWALRPFGKSGPPAMHFAAAEDYYQSHGREWERYALIKARVVAGDAEAGAALLQNLGPFVYRRYLDYTAIESLRELKARIAEDFARRQQREHVKLGRGGIRDVEFIVQAFQLIRGGQEAALRTPSLRAALRAIAEAGHMEPEVAEALEAAYVYLRRVENALQMRNDAQVHSLPDDDEGRAALAAALDTDWDSLMTTLDGHRERVAREFDALFAGPRVERGAGGTQGVVARLWQDKAGSGDDAELVAGLADRFGQAQASAVAERIRRMRDSGIVRDMRELSQSRIGDLLCQLASEAEDLEAPGKALGRALEVVERLCGRSTYVSLLRESPTARAQLLRLCMASPWITHQLAQQPMLLDQLLDARALFQPPERTVLAAELQRRLADMPEADTEARMNLLRRYRQEVMLRLAAADSIANLPLPQVSDGLTWLAEVIMEAAVEEVWREMQADYGAPENTDGSPAGFAVIGYGKFGGIEMGYGSDLDVVFLHDCDSQERETAGGRRSIANAVWFARFAQRLVHWLSTQTAAGRAYEVDLQLRPSGSSGLLVTSFEAFAHYQRERAWTWEHQALVRARFVCGRVSIGEAFTELRSELLRRPRDAGKLAADIVAMRARMRSHLDKSDAESWDIKQGEGGLADLEFVTQFLVLAHAADHPELTRWPDQWRQTEAFVEAGLIDVETAEAAVGAYRELRAMVHERALDEAALTAPADAAREARAVISRLWHEHVQAAADGAK